MTDRFGCWIGRPFGRTLLVVHAAGSTAFSSLSLRHTYTYMLQAALPGCCCRSRRRLQLPARAAHLLRAASMLASANRSPLSAAVSGRGSEGGPPAGRSCTYSRWSLQKGGGRASRPRNHLFTPHFGTPSNTSQSECCTSAGVASAVGAQYRCKAGTLVLHKGTAKAGLTQSWRSRRRPGPARSRLRHTPAGLAGLGTAGGSAEAGTPS